ncbi:MAG TPA: hypothetical protein VJ770_29465 [Stellaceae bacterium]|nr:hypothetical protein [Stellaceae bacterium]
MTRTADTESTHQDVTIGPISDSVTLRGRFLRNGWELPADLTEEEWIAYGAALGKMKQCMLWWIGEWWAYSEHRWGARKAITKAEGWQGPDYKTCANAASVCRAFESSRRRELLSFKHHAEVAGQPEAEADELLDWAKEPIAETGKPHSTRELRIEVKKRRAAREAHEPAAPAANGKAADEAPNPSPRVSRLSEEIHNIILRVMKQLSCDERPSLFCCLREKIDDLEQKAPSIYAEIDKAGKSE